LATGDADTAQALYSAVLEQDENNAAAFAGLARALIAVGHEDHAQAMIDNAPETLAKDAQIAAVRTALELARSKPAGASANLAAAVEKNPADHQARFDLATALFAEGRKEEAIDQLIEIIRRNRQWEEDKARLQLLKFFEALGPADPLVAAGRRKLSSVLFS
jgi:putative thioredoxin